MRPPQREAILSLFERHRQTPGADFSEAHFLDYLLANPGAKGAVRNSFRGLRRFNAFIDDVQLTFGVCFSQADRDRAWSLEKFAERVAELQGSRRGSLASLKTQERAGAGWQVVVIIDFLLFVVALGLRAYPAVSVIAMVLGAGATIWFYRFVRENRRYLSELRTRIEQ